MRLKIQSKSQQAHPLNRLQERILQDPRQQSVQRYGESSPKSPPHRASKKAAMSKLDRLARYTTSKKLGTNRLDLDSLDYVALPI
jgi:hypothetical protein